MALGVLEADQRTKKIRSSEKGTFIAGSEKRSRSAALKRSFSLMSRRYLIKLAAIAVKTREFPGRRTRLPRDGSSLRSRARQSRPAQLACRLPHPQLQLDSGI